MFCQEVENDLEEVIEAPWKVTFEVGTEVRHEFTIKQAQNIGGCGLEIMRGRNFRCDKVDPIAFEVDEGPKCFTGGEFHRQLESEFMFADEVRASRSSKESKIVKLPPRIPARAQLKVRSELKLDLV